MAMDSPGLDVFLRRFIPRGIANQVDQACFRGPGPGSNGPTGLVGAGCTLSVTRGNNADVTQANLSAMYTRLMPGSSRTAVWAISPTALNALTQLTMPGILIMMPGDDGSDGLLYGKPFFKTEKLPDIGTPGDVLLFDPNCYVIGYRDLLIDFSDQQQAQWRRGQCPWRVVARIGGAPMIGSTITLANQSATLGAIAVQLTA
jgi:HK97 family phage major capsid protein